MKCWPEEEKNPVTKKEKSFSHHRLGVYLWTVASLFQAKGKRFKKKDQERETETDQWKDLVACLSSLRKQLLQRGSEGSEAP